jgi:undecaprenyl-diphosphatase
MLVKKSAFSSLVLLATLHAVPAAAQQSGQSEKPAEAVAGAEDLTESRVPPEPLPDDGEIVPDLPKTPPKPKQVVPVQAEERRKSLEPKSALPRPPGRTTFQSDPIADGAIIVVSLGSAGILELINSTGEIRPQQIAPDFDPDNLIWIDRGSISRVRSKSAGGYSNLGLGAAALYAVLDPIASSIREQSAQAGLVDAIIYSESVVLTLALTNIVKLAVRRPRPQAYLDAKAHEEEGQTYFNPSTDSALSFFSGHASITGAIGATATYLAFARSPDSPRPWVTLVLAMGLTSFVSVQRVRSGKHFPTDVLAGAFAGAGIGVVVPHLHRTEDVQQRRVWVGFEPASDDESVAGGTLSLTGVF